MSITVFLRQNTNWLGAGALLTFLSSFGQTFFISLFAGHIREDFNLTHGEWGGIYTLGTGLSALVMVWAGGLTDRFRVRSLAPIILSLLVLSCLMMALNPVWWGLIVIIFALRFTGQGMASHIATVAMSRWYVATRGKAISIATLGFSVGEALLPIVFVALMTLYDWRLLWMLSALIAATGIPILLRLLREERTPQSIAKSITSAGMNNQHWTRKKTIKHWLFWFMVPALLGPSAFNTAFFFHQVHYAEIKDISHITLVAYYPFYTIISIIAMLGSGAALDRFGTAKLIPWMLTPMVVAFVLFSGAEGVLTLAAAFFFLALTTGFNSTLPNAFWAEFYGTKHIGSIKAMAAAIMVLGSAIGPGLTGLGIDYGIRLETQYLGVAGYFVFASVLMWVGIQKTKKLSVTP